jgi:N-acetylglucosamine-6-phosphate deacetylase
MSGRAEPFAIVDARIFDGARLHDDMALCVADGRVAGLVGLADAPARREDAAGLLLAPGFVDWQVNGGGDVLFNETPTPEGAAAIAAAHARFGTTALLPTLITDAPAVQRAAADAVAEAIRRGAPGVVGAHFEGPHLSPSRRGAHDADLMRPMQAADRALLARGDLGRVVATVAPEQVAVADVSALAAAGVVVSLGHSDATYEQATACFDAGARAATHLFNAMSPLSHRAPGLVGAALDHASVWVGLIADGWHAHPAALRVACHAKPPERLTLVTDAMPTVGGVRGSFALNGRRVTREGGRLTLGDGVLAGSDLDMASAVRFMVDVVGVPLTEALAMASLRPARLLGLDAERGRLAAGARADIVALDAGLRPARVWIGGRAVEGVAG